MIHLWTNLMKIGRNIIIKHGYTKVPLLRCLYCDKIAEFCIFADIEIFELDRFRNFLHSKKFLKDNKIKSLLKLHIMEASLNFFPNPLKMSSFLW